MGGLQHDSVTDAAAVSLQASGRCSVQPVSGPSGDARMQRALIRGRAVRTEGEHVLRARNLSMIAGVAAAALVLGACGSSSTAAPAASSTSAAATTAAATS